MAKFQSEKVISIIFWVVGTALLLVSILSNSWITSSQVNYGLLEWCLRHICTAYEQIYPTENPLFRHIILPRILLFCGGGITAIGLIFALIETCSKSSCPVITDGILNIIGGGVVWSACIIFTIFNFHASSIRTSLLNIRDFPFEDGQHFHFSFYFGWISGLMYLAAGIYGIIAGQRSSKRCF